MFLRQRATETSPSLDLFPFASGSYALRSESGSAAQVGYTVWDTPEADILFGWLEMAPMPLQPGIASPDELTASFADREGDPRRLVEVVPLRLCGVPGFLAIHAFPQEPSGFTYSGQIALPFADRHVRFVCRGRERGVTGLRETALLSRALAVGAELEFQDGNRFHVEGLHCDAREHDPAFPGHPLSRVRRVLEHLATTLRIDPAVRTWPRPPQPVFAALP